MRGLRGLLLFVAGAAVLPAQNARTVQATGAATVSVNPDQAQLTAGVVTQGATAQDAGQQNAALATAVIAALKSALGTAGTVQTIGYSITPRYSNTQSSVITGYTASNTVLVTTFDLSNSGRLIDVASQSGASNIGGVSFGLQNPDPVKRQALTETAKQALADAAAIAAGLGLHAGAVLSAQEGSSVTPLVTPGTAATATPILSGAVSVTATVTVSVQLTQ
jgi:uncharacterized protein YggE